MEALSEHKRELLSNNEASSVGINVLELAKEAHGMGEESRQCTQPFFHLRGSTEPDIFTSTTIPVLQTVRGSS